MIVWSSGQCVALSGPLDTVSSLDLQVENSTVILTWTAPFSLDITGVDPDITYCVDVINSTATSSVMMILDTECEITETMFVYSLPSISMQLRQVEFHGDS